MENTFEFLIRNTNVSLKTNNNLNESTEPFCQPIYYYIIVMIRA